MIHVSVFNLSPIENIVLPLPLAPYDPEIYQPLEPLLTSRAKRGTPQLGKNSVSTSLSTTLAQVDLMQFVKVEAVNQPPTPDLSDAL
jgi:hypothetical protein